MLNDSRAALRSRPSERGGLRVALLLWGIAAGLCIAITAVAVIKAWPLLYPNVSDRAPLNPSCDLLAERCSVRFQSGGEVSLDILPRGVPAVHPLQIQVSLNDLPPPERVEVDFSGVDMDMGFNRSPLQPGSGSGQMASADSGGVGVGPGSQWVGDGMLPVCVRQRMTWEARVLLHYPHSLLAAPFRFDTVRPEER